MANRTRRVRHEPPKVWHNPDVVGVRGSKPQPRPGRSPASSPQPGADLPAAPPARSGREAPVPRSGRIVAVVRSATDERELERERLLGKLRAAAGRSAITRAADELLGAGFELPGDEQEVHVQMLEHADERRVRTALAHLTSVAEVQPIRRFAVLEARLRSLEELAEEEETRRAASDLRRRARPLERRA